MRLFGARVLVKTGAEGVFCAALPEQGLGSRAQMRRRCRARRRGHDGGADRALPAAGRR
jgi:L-asparaginase II